MLHESFVLHNFNTLPPLAGKAQPVACKGCRKLSKVHAHSTAARTRTGQSWAWILAYLPALLWLLPSCLLIPWIRLYPSDEILLDFPETPCCGFFIPICNLHRKLAGDQPGSMPKIRNWTLATPFTGKFFRVRHSTSSVGAALPPLLQGFQGVPTPLQRIETLRSVVEAIIVHEDWKSAQNRGS